MTKTLDKTAQYLTFKLGQETFGINIASVREVLKPTKITHIPAATDFLKGVINVRGNVVPVVDLQTQFKLPHAGDSQRTRVIIVESDLGDSKVVLGALADSVDEVIELDASQIEPAPRIGIRLDSRFILGIGKRDGDFIILLDVTRVFSEEELLLAESVATTTSGAMGNST